jgi:hypothetical protein
VPGPALQTYLSSVRAFWRGDNATAASSAEEALRLFPDFPGAAFVRWRAGGSRGHEAWELRDRLSERERTWMTVQLGPQFPEEWQGAAEAIKIAETAFEEHRSWPELADMVATRLFYEGEYVGRANIAQQASNLTVREGGLREEPDYFQLWLFRSRGWAPDTTGLRELADSVLVQATPPRSWEDSLAAYWVAVGLEDTAMLDSLRASGIHGINPIWFRQLNVLEGKPGYPGPDALYDFERSVDAFEARASITRNYVAALHLRLNLARVRREVEEAARLLDTLSRVSEAPGMAYADPWWYLTVAIEHALVESGWDTAARWAAQEQTTRDDDYVGPWYTEWDRFCWPELDRVRRGVTSTAGETSRQMSALISGRSASGICARMLDALAERQQQPNGPAPALTRLDSLMREGPRETLFGVANLVIAQLYAERGDTTLALQAVRRRRYGRDGMGVLPTYLALEAQLSAATGDTTRALAAAQHYLRLRPDPDPALQPQRDSVRALLDSLAADTAIVETDGADP